MKVRSSLYPTRIFVNRHRTRRVPAMRDPLRPHRSQRRARRTVRCPSEMRMQQSWT